MIREASLEQYQRKSHQSRNPAGTMRSLVPPLHMHACARTHTHNASFVANLERLTSKGTRGHCTLLACCSLSSNQKQCSAPCGKSKDVQRVAFSLLRGWQRKYSICHPHFQGGNLSRLQGYLWFPNVFFNVGRGGALRDSAACGHC